MPTFSHASQSKLDTCEDQLQELFREVVKHEDCTVLDGHRGEERQNKAYNQGKSKVKYPNSFHNAFPSKAVDVMPYPIDWDDMKRLHEFAGFVKATAIHMNIDVKWGGNFENFFDGPHWQLG